MPIVFLPPKAGIMSTASETKPFREASIDPFDTTSENEHDEHDEHDEREEEWWSDDESVVPRPKDLVASSRITRWPVVERRGQINTTKSSKRYSVEKLTRAKSKQRQKKQNEKAGIKVITDFSRHHGPAPVTKQPRMPSNATRSVPQAIGFVDLAALQALDNQAPNPAGGLWKSIKGIIPNKSGVSDTRDATETNISPNLDVPKIATPVGSFGGRREERLIPVPIKLEADLSPCDRPIVIGISVPSAKLAQHIASPQTASSGTSRIREGYESRSPEEGTPETPAIVISAPPIHSNWSPLQSDSTSMHIRARATSSVYSRTNFIEQQVSTDTYPMPQAIAFAPCRNQDLGQESGSESRYSTGTIFAEDEDPYSPDKSRVMSSCTVFEEDESPILSRAISVPAAEGRKKLISIDTTADSRTSKGWWDAIVTPFLTQSNTLASPRSPVEQRPLSPNLETAAVREQVDSGDCRTWEKSFSPKTPETSTTIASDVWWDKRNTLIEQTKLPEFGDNAHSPDLGDEDVGTLPFILSIGNPGATMVQNGDSRASNHTPETSPVTLQRRSTARSQVPRFSLISPSNREAPLILGDSVTYNTFFTTPQVQSQQTRHDNIGTIASMQGPEVNNVATQIVTNEPAMAVTSSRDVPSEEPPPQYSPPRPTLRRYHAIFPPGHPHNNLEPLSPGPISPGAQQEITMRGGIALSDVPLTPAPQPRPINLNSGYPGLPDRTTGFPYTADDLGMTSKKPHKAEAKRRRHEKEDSMAHKVGGLWRGRGCVPKRGCYGRSGAEGRKKRRCYFYLIMGFLTMIILVLALALTLHRTQSPATQQSQWLNLTGFPPIYIGISTISAPDNIVANTGCVFPATMWSCALPKELQSTVVPNQPNQPNFRLQIQWDNSTTANTTFANVTGNPGFPVRSLPANAVSAGHFIKNLLLKARQSVLFVPSPTAPRYGEQFFLGNTTDGIVSYQKAGEPTPFYISFMSTTKIINPQKRDQSQSNPFPDVVSSIPPPDLNADGTAAAANLLPFPVQQPLRLYDRGLPTEHYGFYTYFNRSIFLKSNTPLNASNLGEGEVPDDENGGARETEASVRCTWSETRFLVQMWTHKNTTAKLIGSPTSSTSLSANETGNDFTRPGSFPYPVTVTLDRHGGDPATKLLYCYGLDSRERAITPKLQQENKGFGGSIINQAPSLFVNSSDPALGGYDGGSGGCKCQWQNWVNVINS